MNYNMTLTCDICEQDVDCRIGLSNREIQPLNFACPHCGSLVLIRIEYGQGIVLSGAQEHKEKQYGMFDGRNPFVDLHLDFPVWFNDYIPGMTPFMVAMDKIKGGDKTSEQSLAFMQFHTQRLERLNHFHKESNKIRTILKLYGGRNKQLFKTRVEQFLDVSLGPSLKPQDINAALYRFISYVFLPFVHLDGVVDLIENFSALMMDLSKHKAQAFNAFVDHMKETNFLHEIQKDCLDLYPEIYDAELPLRPALFLDFVDGYERNKIAARVSAHDFKTYKDVYKDAAEIFGRQLILVAAINNIIHRDGYDNFRKPKDGNALSSLDKFADKTLTDKFKYLDDCWYQLGSEAIDISVRNAIAHFTTEYDEVRQIITYFPEKEGVRQEKGETMFFLDFMRMLLSLFREVHYLHHVIKSLLYYEYLIRGPSRAK